MLAAFIDSTQKSLLAEYFIKTTVAKICVPHVWEPEVGVPQRRWSWLTQTLIKAGHHISNSFAAKLKHRGIARTTAVFNVADLPQTSLKPPPVKSRALNVLYAGTAGRAQELASALRAIARAREHVDVRLRVVGVGRIYPRCKIMLER